MRAPHSIDSEKRNKKKNMRKLQQKQKNTKTSRICHDVSFRLRTVHEEEFRIFGLIVFLFFA